MTTLSGVLNLLKICNHLGFFNVTGIVNALVYLFLWDFNFN